MRTLDDVQLAGKRVLARVDLNVPLAAGRVTDTTRIDLVVPTLREILAKGGTVILPSHFGRPQGRDPNASLRPVGTAVTAALGRRVAAVVSTLTDLLRSNCDGDHHAVLTPAAVRAALRKVHEKWRSTAPEGSRHLGEERSSSGACDRVPWRGVADDGPARRSSPVCVSTDQPNMTPWLGCLSFGRW